MTTRRSTIHDIDPAPEPAEQQPRPPQKPATPQADGSSESLHKAEKPTSSESSDEHMGATEDEVSETSAPAGPDYQDEPKQG